MQKMIEMNLAYAKLGSRDPATALYLLTAVTFCHCVMCYGYFAEVN